MLCSVFARNASHQISAWLQYVHGRFCLFVLQITLADLPAIAADFMLHRDQAADWHIKCLNSAGGGGRTPFRRLRTHQHILTHALGISGASAQERE
jgi:hypothetical protein